MTTSSNYKMVLSDKLFTIYKKASTQHPLNSKERKIYESLIGNVELDILTNLAQLKRCKEQHSLPDIIYNDLVNPLIADEDKDLTLIELSKKTLYKFILTQAENETNPPYFNLKQLNIARNFTITRRHDQDRDYLKMYFQHLFENAKKILIHDHYFSEEENNKQLFQLLPDKHVSILYIENRERKNGEFIKKACDHNEKWTLEQCDTKQDEFNRFARSHDRYLLIDAKLEISLTSGFSYIWNENKEITCVIREIT